MWFLCGMYEVWLENKLGRRYHCLISLYGPDLTFQPYKCTVLISDGEWKSKSHSESKTILL